ncbi:hypothetical protein XELAEV_18028325mg [Xenopus laevis]|uniref:P2X purinoreceptor 7 intracellular domain-containing protein n=1 Tax=Xenopus laevis TaxID=8355 RepID=A0A974CWX3_XENLA|nr:hypothetical protein XELAEV_18028325mg [Xenopus laevis]
MRSRPEVRNVRDCFPYNPPLSKKQNTGSIPETDDPNNEESMGKIENKEYLGNCNWCHCRNCTPMDAIMESMCFHDEPAICAMIPTEDGLAIVISLRMSSLLKSVLIGPYKVTNFNVKKQPKEDTATYRSFSVWIYGYLGTGLRLKLFRCVQLMLFEMHTETLDY